MQEIKIEKVYNLRGLNLWGSVTTNDTLQFKMRTLSRPPGWLTTSVKLLNDRIESFHKNDFSFSINRDNSRRKYVTSESNK